MSEDLFGRYLALLKAGGTNRLQRTLPALEDGYVRPDERSPADLLAYARALARELRFFNLSGQASGDWRGLFEPLADPAGGPPRSIEEWLAASPPRRDWPPHLALFLAFLHLFENLQKDLAELPRRHLRHYLEEVLGLRRRPAAGDAVHVIFELARHAAPTLIAAGTPLDAGKDAAGRPLTYLTRGDLVVSAAKVAQIRRLVAEVDRAGVRRYFVADAPSELEGASWQTFGARQLALDPGQRFMREAEIGFAVASPLLRLAEGERRLTLRATLRAAPGRTLPPPQGIGFGLLPQLTGAAGWLAPEAFDAQLVAQDSQLPAAAATRLEMHLTLGAGAPAVVSFDKALHGVGGPALGQPLLRCLVRGESGLAALLDGLRVEQIELAVEVKGMAGVVLQNDEGPLAAGAPAPLFGSQPRIGSRFYLGSAEAFGKRLSSLAVHLAWQDPPADLFAHYRAYFDHTDSNLENGFRSLFKADVDLLEGGSFAHPLLRDQPLFAGTTAEPRSLGAGLADFEQALGGRTTLALAAPEPLGNPAAGARYGFLRFTLRGPAEEELRDSLGQPYAEQVPFSAFGHQAFGRRFALQTIALSKYDPMQGGAKPELPSEPYTPTLAAVTLDYRAEAKAAAGDRQALDTLLAIEPWGFSLPAAGATARLVPDLDPPAGRGSEQPPFAGSLFLGIERLAPPANLSLLFQIERGTAAAEAALTAAAASTLASGAASTLASGAASTLASGETEWSQLAAEGWQPLPASAVLNDATRGFQQPGLVVLAVGAEAGTRHTAMPSGLVWLRALIRRPPESAARTRALHSQAVLAELAPDAAASPEALAAHLREGLAADSISRLRRRDPAIGRVSQPYPSFGGRAAENDAELLPRASERLRHRRRAVTAWDLERLVLDAFPEVFKVKVLPHSDAAGRPRAGEAALVIVPDLRGSGSAQLLEPRAGVALLEAIREYLREGLATPFATLHVIHPVYERLVVDARVAFLPGLDAGFHAARLAGELQRFLSPWAFEEGQDIVFGARIYRSEVLAFIEGRGYVDFVTDFSLYHQFSGPPQGGGIGTLEIGLDFLIGPSPRRKISSQPGGMVIGRDFVVGRGVEVAEASQPHAILVSHPAHRIAPLEAGSAPCGGPARLGIGYMTLGLDFEVFHS